MLKTGTLVAGGDNRARRGLIAVALASAVTDPCPKERNMPSEHDKLNSYLVHVGLEQYCGVFEAYGVTSLKLIKMLGTDVGAEVRKRAAGC